MIFPSSIGTAVFVRNIQSNTSHVLFVQTKSFLPWGCDLAFSLQHFNVARFFSALACLCSEQTRSLQTHFSFVFGFFWVVFRFDCKFQVRVGFACIYHQAISDAHEWINEIPTVPVYYPAASDICLRQGLSHARPCHESVPSARAVYRGSDRGRLLKIVVTRAMNGPRGVNGVTIGNSTANTCHSYDLSGQGRADVGGWRSARDVAPAFLRPDGKELPHHTCAPLSKPRSRNSGATRNSVAWGRGDRTGLYPITALFVV